MKKGRETQRLELPHNKAICHDPLYPTVWSIILIDCVNTAASGFHATLKALVMDGGERPTQK